jgi:hypothetical protein
MPLPKSKKSSYSM